MARHLENSVITLLWVTPLSYFFSLNLSPRRRHFCFLHSVHRLQCLLGDISKHQYWVQYKSFLFVSEPSRGLRYPHVSFFLTPCLFLEIKCPQLPHCPVQWFSDFSRTCSLPTLMKKAHLLFPLWSVKSKVNFHVSSLFASESFSGFTHFLMLLACVTCAHSYSLHLCIWFYPSLTCGRLLPSATRTAHCMTGQ